MRIAYVSADPGVPVFGCKGCSVHVQEVIRALQRTGAVVELHTVRTGGEAPADLAGVRVFEYPLDRSGDAANVERRARDIDESLFASMRSRPAYDLVYERYSLWSTAAMDFARKSGIPGVIEVNAPLIEEQATHRTLVDRGYAEQVATHVFEAASVVVAVSREVAAYVCTTGADPDRVHVLPNGVDPGRFHPRDEASVSGDFTVGFVGSLKPWHDLTTLAAAYLILRRYHPNSRLLVVGDGPERTRLEELLASEDAADSVIFSGAVQPIEVPTWMSRMDVGVAPYSQNAAKYFSPLKVLEYMAAGLPVLGSHTGQIPELVEDGRSGLLYYAEDAPALACAMLALADDPSLRLEMGRAGRDAVLQYHSWDGVVESTLRFAREAYPGQRPA
ncbi:MAG: glycosyltransferase family 4 protein [Deltaproteobacteria bacterium]|nr:glycosyltransferase family 4 protein [Deltaproteobacteria bacterium]MBW2387509.1 glycosyltransferase family 4 protein [Deltaproteobacteria bacterium]